jgi:cellulase
MHTPTLLLIPFTLLIHLASAHGFVTGLTIASKFTPGSDPVWFYYDHKPDTAGWDALNQDIGFVEPAKAGTSDVNCHKNATAGKLYASANPGDEIVFSWNTWPDSHKGPIINYLAPCNGE